MITTGPTTATAAIIAALSLLISTGMLGTTA